MNFNLIGFKINFLKNIGDMSDKKIEILTKKFSDDFPIRQAIPNGVVFNKNVDSSTNKSLFILQNQVTYSIEGENAETNFYEAKNFTKKVFDTLYLDYKCFGICNYTALIESNDLLETFKTKLDVNLKKNSNKGIQGAGIKLFIDDDKYAGNFLFEPFVRDSKYIFCSLDIQFKNISGINEVVIESEKIIKDFFSNIINESYYKIKKLGEN